MSYLIPNYSSGKPLSQKLKKYKNQKVVLFLPEERDLLNKEFIDVKSKKYFRRLLKQNNIKIEYWLSDPGNDKIDSPLDNVNIVNWPMYTVPWTWYLLDHSTIKPMSNIEKIFVTLNNKPRIHRYWTMEEIYRRNLQEYGFISWHGPRHNDLWLDKPTTVYFEDKLISLDDYDERHQQNIMPPQFFKSLINLVTETDHKRIDITEKTYAAIICKKPFIVVGAPRVHERLEYFGFKKFKFIDYGFDTITDPKKRISAIIDQLETFKSQNLNALYQGSIDILEHNYNRVLEIINDKNTVPDSFWEIAPNLFKLKNQYEPGAVEWIYKNYNAETLLSTGRRFIWA